MKRFVAPSVGLLGRVVAILLLTLLIEAGVSTLLYERANQFAVRGDEARRLAEHLVLSRRLVTKRPDDQRAGMARALTTDRYLVRWDRGLPPPSRIAPAMGSMHDEVVAWEPALAAADLRLRVTAPGGRSTVAGGVRLADGSWLYFRTLHPVVGLDLPFGRILLALVPALALMLLAGALVRRTLWPLRRLVEAADRIGIDAEQPVTQTGRGWGELREVRRLVGAFNRMQRRIRQLVADRTQALAAVGHDLRTPLARLRLRAERVASIELRTAIDRDIDEMDAMIGSLLTYLAGGGTEAPTSIDLAVLCATLIDDLADHGRDAHYAGPDHLEIRVRATGLRRAIGNLADNALNHGNRLTLSVEDRGAQVAVIVDDDGPGIPDAALADVLHPFVRLDSARGRDTKGFGLGLSIAAQAVAADGGTLTLSNRAGGGLRAQIVLPR